MIFNERKEAENEEKADCFVSCDIESDRKLDKETTYYNSIHKLPDGRKIRISNEKFEAPEILFHPFLIQNESPGVHEILYNSINVSNNFFFIYIL